MVKKGNSNKKLLAIAKSANVPVEGLIKDYDKFLAETKNEKLALNRVVNQLRRKLTPGFRGRGNRAKPEVVYGFIVADTGVMDRLAKMRREAKAAIEEQGKEVAMDMGLINESEEVLDQRSELYGRANPKHLEPLGDAKELRRTLFGCFKKNAAKFKRGSLHTENNQLALAWEQVKNFTPCMTYAIIKNKASDPDMTMNSSIGKETRTVFKAIKEDYDILETIEKCYEFTEIKEVENYHEKFKDAWDRFIVVRGMIGWINVDRPTKWNAIYASIVDPELGFESEHQVRILIPEHIPVNFGECSEVIVFGKTRRAKSRDPETQELEDADVIIDVWGIYPIPGLTTEPSAAKLEEAEEIDGWLE